VKGTECTPAQIEHAKDFIIDRGWKSNPHQRAMISLDDFARMLARYGAVRFQAGRDNTGGTLEQPGPIVDVEQALKLDEESVGNNGPRRWVCKQCGAARRASECLACGNEEPITDERVTSGIVR